MEERILPKFKEILSHIIKNDDVAYIKESFDYVSMIQKKFVRDGLVPSSPFSYLWSQNRANQSKNRYTNIFPYDYNRVVLEHRSKSKPPKNIFASVEEAKNSIFELSNDLKSEYLDSAYDNGYINASWIQPPLNISNTEYIATQGPTNKTSGDFWDMVYENRCPVIVMLTKTVESGYEKCSEYWPTNINIPKSYGKVTVTLISETDAVNGSTKLREFIVSSNHKFAVNNNNKQEICKVTQYHFLGWPDKFIPHSTKNLQELLTHTRNTKLSAYSSQPFINQFSPIDNANASSIVHNNKDSQYHLDKFLNSETIFLPSTGPTIVHCSAGCGRTGTFIILDIICEYFKNNKDYSGDIIYDLFFAFRLQRVYFIQTLDQLLFVYSFVYKYLNEPPQ
ncbi:Receptor-type tyrosine-protein phosphatase kappa [Smittium culicis]|uniref:Receptor-type tyrosine-protein phosphatase kappa n=1 Tax=Smittium culicis TaxID=133412 RepID=A0A1R1X230_9FUNG|nr:Receptor-type tyrosine-protein phosphatase kappa [Smittium culicis]